MSLLDDLASRKLTGDAALASTRKFIETKIDANTKLIMNSGVMNSIRWDKIEGENPEEIKEIFIEVNNELKDFLYKRLQWLIKEWEYNE